MDASAKHRLLTPAASSPQIHLPPPRALADAPPGWQAEADGATPLKVLVVDDNADFATSLARLIAHCGHRTQIALDGYAAVEMAEAFRPHLILVDLNMPGLDGYEVCQRVRGTAWGAHTAIAAVSGLDQVLRRCGPRAGFDFRLEKPLAFDTLERLLARFA